MFVPRDDTEEEEMAIEQTPKSLLDYLREWFNFLQEEQQQQVVATRRVTQPSKKRVVSDQTRVQQDVSRKRGRLEDVIQERRDLLGVAQSRKSIDYIGDDSKIERIFRFRDITLRPTDNTMRGRGIEDGDQFVEDPYDFVKGKTWRNLFQLAAVQIPQLFVPNAGPGTKKDFDALYDQLYYQTAAVESYSRPEIFVLEVAAPNREKFKEILYGDTQLLMKLTPFIDSQGRLIPEREVDQIYNEIRIAYFLAELLYNYTNVLSVHFMVMVDWFQSSRAKLGLYANPLVPTPADTLYDQVTISEYAGTDMLTFLSQNTGFQVLRAVIFEVLHSLETAWHSHEFVHGDLHVGNIQMKRTNYEESPFRNKNLLYKRRNIDDWYVLPKEALGDHLVKIIDFGFSRIYAPSKEQHVLYSQSTTYPPHLHDKFVGIQWPENGMDPVVPNRYVDVRLFFLTLFVMPPQYFAQMSETERNAFYALAEQVLDFDWMNRAIDATGFQSEPSNIRRYSAGGRLTAVNLNTCRPCIDYLMRLEGPVRTTLNWRNNWTATDVLNQPFFDALRRPTATQATELQKQVAQRENVVVSFINDETLRETQMLKREPASPFFFQQSTSLACAMCQGKAKHYNMDGQVVVPLCGSLCAEFKYLYNGKTVFR